LEPHFLKTNRPAVPAGMSFGCLTAMPSQPPRVSLCIPACNGYAFVAEALSSALAQTRPADEIVISDSGSTDGTLDELARVTRERCGNIRVLPDTTPGMVPNWNAAAKAASGDYVKFLFQDDVLEPRCLQAMLQIATTDPRIGLVFCRRRVIVEPSAEGTHVARWYREHEDLSGGFEPLQKVQDGRQLLARRTFLDEPLNKIGEPSAVLIRKDAFESLGGFDPSLRQLVDLDLWLRLLSNWRVGFVNESLVRFRVHDRQVSSVNARTHEAHGEEDEIMKRLARPEFFRWLHPSVKIRLRQRLLDLGEAPPRVGVGVRVYGFARSVYRTGKRIGKSNPAPLASQRA
jgi:glycosyltransferase involved in cell wall biosynthesis